MPAGEVCAAESSSAGKVEKDAGDRDKEGRRYVWKSLGVTLSGYLEGSYTQNFNNPPNGINQLRIFDVDANQFRPNVAKIVLEREANAGGTGWDRAGFRVKFNPAGSPRL